MSIDTGEMMKINTIALERVRFNAQEYIAPDMLRLKFDHDIVTDHLVARLTAYLYGRPVESVGTETFYYPATWWDAMKEVLARKLWKPLRRLIKTINRSSIDQQVTKYYHVCPHMTVDPREQHLTFVSAGSKQEFISREVLKAAREAVETFKKDRDYMTLESAVYRLMIALEKQEKIKVNW